MDEKRIVICGGHLAPALAVIQLLQKKKDYRIFFIGRRNASEGDKTDSLEYLTLTKLKVPFYSLNSSRFQRCITWYTLPSLVKFPIALIQSFYYLLQIKPKIVLSFGGYIALPVCIAAYLLKIPVITHEQTHIMGLANRIISQFAKIVCLSWSDTQSIPRKAKTILTGNPIRKEIFSPSSLKTLDFGDKNLPLIYVTGGSLGSRSINKLIGQALSSLATRFRLIHQCGSAEAQTDYKLLTKIKDSLPQVASKNYWPIPHIDPSFIGSILHNADLIICRSGANTVTEIAAVGIPAILIPLPWAADKEQEYNAKMLEQIGSAKILRQEQATDRKLIDIIESMMRDITRYRENARTAKKLIKVDAAKLIFSLLKSYLQ